MIYPPLKRGVGGISFVSTLWGIGIKSDRISMRRRVGWANYHHLAISSGIMSICPPYKNLSIQLAISAIRSRAHHAFIKMRS
jgi:hypothetical protein